MHVCIFWALQPPPPPPPPRVTGNSSWITTETILSARSNLEVASLWNNAEFTWAPHFHANVFDAQVNRKLRIFHPHPTPHPLPHCYLLLLPYVYMPEVFMQIRLFGMPVIVSICGQRSRCKKTTSNLHWNLFSASKERKNEPHSYKMKMMMIKDIVRRKMLLPMSARLGQTWMCWALVPLRICVLRAPRFAVPKTQSSSSHPSLFPPLWRSSINSGRSRAKCSSCHWVTPGASSAAGSTQVLQQVSPSHHLKGLRWPSLLQLQLMNSLSVRGVNVAFRALPIMAITVNESFLQ